MIPVSIVCVGIFAAFVMKMSRLGELNREMAAGGDISQVLPLRETQIPERLAKVRQAFAGTLPESELASAEEVQQIEKALKTTFDEVSLTEDYCFGDMLDRDAYGKRVMDSGLLSRPAILGFRDFPEWNGYFSPFRYAGIQTIAVTRNTATNEFIAYSLTNHSAGTSRVAWYLHRVNNEFKLIDFHRPDYGEMSTEEAAREYSAALIPSSWDNYIEILQSDLTPTGIADSPAEELRRLGALTVPRSVQHLAVVHLIELASAYELYAEALPLLDRLKAMAEVPLIYSVQAEVHLQLGNYDKANDAITRFEAEVGPGSDVDSLRANIMLAAGREEECAQATLAAIKRTKDIEWVPNDCLNVLQSEHLERLLKIVNADKDPSQAACRMATHLLNRDRMDLAEPLLPIADAMQSSTPELHILRGLRAEDTEDSAAQIEHFALAIASLDQDDERYDEYNCAWLYAHEETQYVDAILHSRDAVDSLFELAMDDDEPMVDRKLLTEMSDALQQCSSSDPDMQAKLERWKPVIRAVALWNSSKPQEAWEGFNEFYKTPLATQLVDDDYAESVGYWAAEAAVRSDHISESVPLVEAFDGDPVAFIRYAVEIYPTAERCDAYCETFPTEANSHYMRAYAAELRGDDETAVKNYLAHIDSIETEDTYQVSMSQRRRGTLLCKREDWADHLQSIPEDQWIAVLGHTLMQQLRVDDAQLLLSKFPRELRKQGDAINLDSWIKEQRQDWSGLTGLYKRTRAQDDAAMSAEESKEVLTVDCRERFLAALLKAGDFATVDRYLSQLEKSRAFYNADGWRLHLAVAKMDKESIKAQLAASRVRYHLCQQDTFGSAIWNSSFDAIREEYPPDCRFLPFAKYFGGGLTIMQDSNAMLTVEQLRSKLPAVNIEDLTPALIANLETTATVSRRSDPSIQQPTQNFPGKLYRISTAAGTFLIWQWPEPITTNRTGNYFRFEDDADEIELPDDLKQALDQHRMWTRVQLESVTDTATPIAEMRACARLAAVFARGGTALWY